MSHIVINLKQNELHVGPILFLLYKDPKEILSLA